MLAQCCFILGILLTILTFVIILFFSAWVDDSMCFPPNKSQGRNVMTSDFIEPISGVVRYSDEVWAEIKEREDIKEEIKLLGEERARRAGSILDTSKDGYYTGEKARPDFLKVKL